MLYMNIMLGSPEIAVGIFHQGLIAKPCHHVSKDRLMRRGAFEKIVPNCTVY